MLLSESADQISIKNDLCRYLNFNLAKSSHFSDPAHDQHLVEEFLDLVRKKAFLRHQLPGHATGSGCLLSFTGQSILLTFHKKLSKWLQLGGHLDEHETPFQAALRECSEESGISVDQIRPIYFQSTPLLIDLDIHQIPARSQEPAHLHYDFRYVFCTGSEMNPEPETLHSDESNALKWVQLSQLEDFSSEPSLLRLGQKLQMFSKDLFGTCR